MVEIGSFEAKTHFAEIVQKAFSGETYLITKNGKPVARILPPENNQKKAEEAIARILEIRQKYKLPQKEIQKLIKKGRRY